MKHGVYGPLRWEAQLIHHRGEDPFNFEGSISPWGQFDCSVWQQ